MKTCSHPALAPLQHLCHLLAAFAAAVLLCGAVQADPLAPADGKGVRAAVEGQLAAFARDDAAKAFSFAAPNVRKTMGTPQAFMAMVRRDYPVVYRPASVAFLKPDGKDDQAVQRVQMADSSGASWLAVYSLERQGNKAWRITGCVVVENRGRMT